MSQNRPLNRVYLRTLPFREFRIGGRHGTAPDGSALPYLIENLVAATAVQIVIPDCSPASLFVDGLAPAFKPRVAVEDAGEAFARAQSLLAPLREEYAIDFWIYGAFSMGKEVPDEIQSAVFELFCHLPEYLFAIQHRLQIDLDLVSLIQTVRCLRAHSRNPESRAVLAILEGLFGTYSAVEMGALSLSGAPVELIESFDRLVGDSHYQAISQEIHALGLRERGVHTLSRIRRGILDVLANRGFAKLFSLGSKLIRYVTKIPCPDSETLAGLLSDHYLPPIISLSEELELALSRWRSENPRQLFAPEWKSILALSDQTAE